MGVPVCWHCEEWQPMYGDLCELCALEAGEIEWASRCVAADAVLTRAIGPARHPWRWPA